MKTPILGGYAVARSVNAADNRLMNLYPEATPEGGKTSGFLTRCPGYKYVSDVGSGPIRGLWTFGGFLYVVSGVELYKVAGDWTATLLGTVSGSGPVSMSDNGDQLFVACNPRSYTYSVASNTFAEITDPDFPGAVTVGFINGYFVFNEPNSQKVWITSYQDGASVDPLEFSYTDANPDNLLSLIVNRNEIWMFGTTSTEVWYYSGDIDFPLARIQGAFNEIGCAAPYSVAKLDNTVFWLGSDPRGNAMVYKAAGYGAQRVSTHGIEKVLQGYQYVGDAIGYSYQQEGHTFYVLTFPSANATWVFDAATNEWHERGSWKQGHYNRHRSNCQANFNNTIVLGDFQYGKLYEFDLEYYQDDVGTQRWVRSWRALPPNANNLNRTAHHSLQVELETGTRTIEAATTSPIPPSSQVQLSYTSTFSPVHVASDLTLSNGNLTVEKSSPVYDWSSAQSVKTWYNGELRYCEFTIDATDANGIIAIGIGQARAPYILNSSSVPGTPDLVYYFAYVDGVYQTQNILGNGLTSSDLTSQGNAQVGDVIMLAVQCGDVSAWDFGYFGPGSSMGGKVWVGRNGTWFNGDPSTMTGGMLLFSAAGQPNYPYMAPVAAVVSLLGVNTVTANFGGQSFSHTVPTGFLAWDKNNPSTYNSFNQYYIGNGSGPNTLEANGSSVNVGVAAPTLIWPCAVTNNSATNGKVYFEASGFAGSAEVGQPYGVCVLGIGESACAMDYVPAGENLPVQDYLSIEGCAIDFVGLESPNAPPGSITFKYGQKWNSGTQAYVPSINSLNSIKRVRIGERIMVAIDFDAGKVWFGSKGTWSGDPVAGTGEGWTFTPNTELYVYASIYTIYAYEDAGSFNVTCHFNPSSFTYQIPNGYTVFNSSGLSASATERIPKVLLRWSDDGGHTWSNYYDREMGSLGEYWTRVIWRRLGMTTKLRDRVYELSGSDPVKITITGAELVLSGTNS